MNNTWESVASSITGKTNLKLRPEQEQLMAGILEGKHCLGILPTGYGKSICYQVPAAIQDGLVIVIVPTISLMHDQAERLKRQGFDSVNLIHSYLDKGSGTAEVMKAIRSKRAILYICPERLLNQHFVNLIREAHVRFLVIDEAHVCLQWSHFRPAYAHLGRTIKTIFPNIPIMALTATLGEELQESLSMQLQTTFHVCVRECPISSKVHIDHVCFTTRLDRFLFLYAQVRKSIISNERGIIFARTRSSVRGLSAVLSNLLGENIGGYHGGLSKEERDTTHNLFAFGNMKWLVATSGFGMGVDVGDVAHVVHYELPVGLLDYVQQIGRGGRSLEEYHALLCDLQGDSKQAHSLLTASIEGEMDSAGFPQHDELLQRNGNVAIREFEKLEAFLGSCTSVSNCLRQELASLVAPGSKYVSGICRRCSSCTKKSFTTVTDDDVNWKDYVIEILVRAAAENEKAEYAVGLDKFVALLTMKPSQGFWPKSWLQKNFTYTGALSWLDESEVRKLLFFKALSGGLLVIHNRGKYKYIGMPH